MFNIRSAWTEINIGWDETISTTGSMPDDWLPAIE